MTLRELISGAELLGMLIAIIDLALLHKRGRRAVYILMRYGKAHMSPWMLAVLGVCAFIPGPLDEIAVFPVLAVLTLRTKRNRAILRRYLRRI